MKKKIAVVILTNTCEKIIKNTINKAKKITKNIIIVDSGSKDKTLNIVKKMKCKIYKRKFKNYSDQRNYIIKKCNKIYEWQLHIDSDEILSEKLIKNIKSTLKNGNNNYSYIIKRDVFFLNKRLHYGGASNWHLRLFPSYSTICEKKEYDNHFISKLKTKKLQGSLLDKNIKNLTDWTTSHNFWSSLAAKDKNIKKKLLIKPKLFGNKIERTRFIKNIILSLPLGLKGFTLFFVKYFLMLGFLDGKVGFIFAFLNSFWFHTLTDAKKYELLNNKNFIKFET